MTQCGKPVVWTMAGSIDKLLYTYKKRFFSEIKVLALTADSEIIRKRMKEGRGITDENSGHAYFFIITGVIHSCKILIAQKLCEEK